MARKLFKVGQNTAKRNNKIQMSSTNIYEYELKRK